METLGNLASWIAQNEALLSGIAASIVIAGVLMSPFGRGLRRLATRSPSPDVAPSPAPPSSSPPPPMVSDRPSIAVLPFEIQDPADDGLAVGLCEDIISGLSRVRAFFVIARSSSATYQGRTVDVREVSTDLGVRYVLEGSVRRMGARLRVSTRLIDATTRESAWSESYDRPLTEVFELQDELTESIVGALQPALRKAEAERARRSPTESLDAWAIVNQAWTSLQRNLEGDAGVYEAVTAVRRAIDLDPDYALAHAVLGYAMGLTETRNGVSAAQAEDSEALASVRHAAAMDPENPLIQHCLGATLSNLGRTPEAIRAYERSLDLDPNGAQARAGLGIARIFQHQSDLAVEEIGRALRQSPRDPLLYNWLAYRSIAWMLQGESERAVKDARASLDLNVSRTALGSLAVATALGGDLDEAARAYGQCRQHIPGFTASAWNNYIPLITREPDQAARLRQAMEAAEEAWRKREAA